MSAIQNDPAGFSEFRAKILQHSRLAGYYLIHIIDITELSRTIFDRDKLLLAIFGRLDDRQQAFIGSGETETDWIADRDAARRRTIESLMAGPNFGHIDYTISKADASQYFDRFDEFFESPKRYYTRLVFGDPQHVFTGGVVIVSPKHAGILWVVEDD